MLLEAQSQRIACVSTRVSGIPELIVDGETGVLVPPRAPILLAEALDRLITDPVIRVALGTAGCERTTRCFSLDAGVDRLAMRLNAFVA